MHSPGRLLLLFFASALVLTIAFLYLQPLVDNIQQVTPAMTTDSIADQDLHTLGNEFNALRQIRGHWEGGAFDKEIDSPKGKKVQVMKALGETLGLPGTPATDILQTMGKPDQMAPRLEDVERTTVSMMPGPIIGSDDNPVPTASDVEPSSYYLVYYWRGKHDYLYFKIGAETEKVLTSGWYNALE